MDRTTVIAFAITLVAIGLAVLIRELAFGRRPAAAPVRARAVAVVDRYALADQAEADDQLRGLRIVADNGSWAAWTTGPQRAVNGQTGGYRLDDRTAELVIDPTLNAREIAEMVEHVEHGAGSVATVAAIAEDTSLRGPLATAALEAAEEAAYVEAERLDMVALFAGFDTAVAARRAEIDHMQALVAGWSFYIHDAEGHECPHCAAALHEISEEHRHIVGEHDTQAWDMRELRAALAVA